MVPGVTLSEELRTSPPPLSLIICCLSREGDTWLQGTWSFALVLSRAGYMTPGRPLNHLLVSLSPR